MSVNQVDNSDIEVVYRRVTAVEGLHSSVLEKIETDVFRATVDVVDASGRIDSLIAALADDGVVTPVEKLQLKKEWLVIEAEYPSIRARALEKRVNTTLVEEYEAAYQALHRFLFSLPGLLVSLKEPSPVDGAAYRAVVSGYSAAKEAILAAIDTQNVIHVLEVRYKRSDLQPEVPTLADPPDWFVFIPAGFNGCWRTQALKYADGSLVNAWSEVTRTPTAEDLDAVRDGSAIIDGAINRAKLEAGFLDEFEQTKSELFPMGLAAASDLSMLKPQWGDANALAEALMVAVKDTEGGYLANLMEIQGEKTKYASLKFDVDGLSSLVGELITGGAGQTVEVTAITQTKSNISLMASEGRIVDYDAAGNPVVDTFAKSQIDVLKDKIALTVQAKTGGGWEVASTIITADKIASAVAESVTTNAGVASKIAEIVQTSDAIKMSVQETIERIDETFAAAQAGISVTSQMIQLEAQSRRAAVDGLSAEFDGKLSLTAENFSLEMTEIDTDLQGTKTYFASEIETTARAINLAVWGEATTPTPGPADCLSAQIAMQADSIGLLVEGAGGSAFFSMSVNLPVFATPEQVNAMASAVGSPLVAAVYGASVNGYYFVKETAADSDVRALRAALKTAGLLGSQIIMDADEILMGGKVHAANLHTEEITIGQGQVSGLGAALSGKETAGAAATSETQAKLALAQKLGYADFAAMEAAATAGQTVIKGGKINTDLITTIALKALIASITDLTADNATFTNCTVNGSFNGSAVVSEITFIDVTPGDNIIQNYLPSVLAYEGATETFRIFQLPCSGAVKITFEFATHSTYATPAIATLTKTTMAGVTTTIGTYSRWDSQTEHTVTINSVDVSMGDRIKLVFTDRSHVDGWSAISNFTIGIAEDCRFFIALGKDFAA